MNRPLRLFDAFGIELEYMIVDKDTLEVKPIADELLKSMAGQYTGDFDNGAVTWSNELVLHVIELKCTKPEHDLDRMEENFRLNVERINKELGRRNAMLLPTAAHPLMDPQKHTKLWPHDNNEIYAVYNKIFDCKGHGWSNLQSTHLNLPFHGDNEFGRLHAAIRIILPLLPALCASSPMLDGKLSGYDDTIKHGMKAEIRYAEYLAVFDIDKARSVRDVFAGFLRELMIAEGPFLKWSLYIQTILDEGNLSMRIRKALATASVQQTWKRLAGCLQNNTMFKP